MQVRVSFSTETQAQATIGRASPWYMVLKIIWGLAINFGVLAMQYSVDRKHAGSSCPPLAA